MRRPSFVLAVLSLLILGCARPEPAPLVPAGASAAPSAAGASQAELLAAGGRLLDGAAVERLEARLGRARLAQALTGHAAAAYTIRADGSLCPDLRDLRTCRLVIEAQGRHHLVDHTGRWRGTI
ncbi:MAG: hypothetical protein EA356_14100 [Geminicoccaceae bacterium]|nr:MAG: hypothetical protein EA356_14100 [Geminicoccaceae bacterium]